ncbi:9135_t:CDS:2 [Gigaspora margarita]|uniref:9135_t:CDS:1 n=1 Tax=Gigaspora margarita TaxID=4874 RepID=A0ABN7VXC7_GIGMA|nr:9135_t:CDS:2 [Gigaspora margarita]
MDSQGQAIFQSSESGSESSGESGGKSGSEPEYTCDNNSNTKITTVLEDPIQKILIKFLSMIRDHVTHLLRNCITLPESILLFAINVEVKKSIDLRKCVSYHYAVTVMAM